eukprot:CAMPEP_0178843296 /NCGR_PEP_ID=MMETSP0746-20121128/16061_1 /TAXON_ID=913974 /ORGANISM="Nitzschia punctata, Strain CCMP561" /LENGTH=782 /DNA_ID=CAMNT_0020506881 /DNA_START=70 /DNA_END=2418 /DNA_ORIENTATION=-
MAKVANAKRSQSNKMPSEYDLQAPPKSIYNPSSSRRSDGGEPGDEMMSDAAMRVQLWDSFRLARIILGKPVKSRRLSNHVILHAIRKVAEMKLHISKLERDVDDDDDDAFFRPAIATPLSDDSSSAPVRRDAASIKREKEQRLKAYNSKRSTALQHQHDMAMEALQYEVGSSEQNGDADNLMNLHSQGSGILSSGSQETASSTPLVSMSSSYSNMDALAEEDNDDDDPVAVLRRQILSQPDDAPPRTKKVGTLTSTAASLPAKPTLDDYSNLLRKQSQEQHEEIETMLKNLHEKLQETSSSTTLKIQALHKKLADAQSQHQAALRQQQHPSPQQQQQSQRMRSTKAAAVRNPRLLQQVSSQRQHREIESMLNHLHDKVRETSEHTSTQIQALHETLANAKEQQEVIHQRAIGDMKQRFNDQQEQQRAHLDSIVLQYLQAQEDLEKELDECRKKVNVQAKELLDWKRKYYRLEGLAMASKDAKRVLKMVTDLEAAQDAAKKPSAVRSRRGAAPNPAKVSEVHREVISLLSRMTQWTEMQGAQNPDLAKHLKMAKEKEVQTMDHLDFLKLQRRLLEEETSKVSPEQYDDLLTMEQERFQKEIDIILEAEELRMDEIEDLEMQLTHLAFLAVQVEEYEKDFLQHQKKHERSLKEIRELSQATAEKLSALQRSVEQTVKKSAAKVRGASPDTTVSAAELRIRELEEALAQKTEELGQTKAQLVLSEERVRALESANNSKRSTRSVVSIMNVDSSLDGALDYDTDSTAATNKMKGKGVFRPRMLIEI